MFKIARGRINNWQVLAAVIFMIFQVVATLYIPNLTSDIVNKGVITGDTDYIIHTGIEMVVVSLITAIAAFGNVLMASQASQGLGRKLRSDLFKKILYFTHDEFDKFETSSLTTRTTNDVIQIQNVMIMMLRMMIMAPIMLIGASFMAYQKSS